MVSGAHKRGYADNWRLGANDRCNRYTVQCDLRRVETVHWWIRGRAREGRKEKTTRDGQRAGKVQREKIDFNAKLKWAIGCLFRDWWSDEEEAERKSRRKSETSVKDAAGSSEYKWTTMEIGCLSFLLDGWMDELWNGWVHLHRNTLFDLIHSRIVTRWPQAGWRRAKREGEQEDLTPRLSG